MNIAQWQHHHSFRPDKEHIEKKTLIVVLITVFMMISEIAFGLITNSMALFADGVHMGTHAFALGISLFAYILARKQSNNSRFAFGTWKIEILGAYTSALILGMVAVMITYSSIDRLLHPVSIHYDQALIVAGLGLLINLACAFILNTGTERDHQDHAHHDGSDHHHHHHKHDDLNLKSAYLHVISDALTSIFALIALFCAKYFGLNFLDPIMGILGAVLITRWAISLLRDSSRILLDYTANTALHNKIKAAIESDGHTFITDLHLWKVSDNSYSCIIALTSDEHHSITEYKNKLHSLDELAHVTLEINRSA